jgi:response regulator of citrate/malate metabolism
MLIDIFIKSNVDRIDLDSQLNTEWSLPVIFISAHYDKVTRDWVFKSAYTSYLLKPFTVSLLT